MNSYRFHVYTYSFHNLLDFLAFIFLLDRAVDTTYTFTTTDI